jgi:hypothetical protein
MINGKMISPLSIISVGVATKWRLSKIIDTFPLDAYYEHAY